MLRSRRSRLAVLLSAGALFGGIATAPAQAQPVVTGGLVNVTIVDAVSHNNVQVQVPIGVAANVCDANVALLAQEFAQGGSPSCTAENTLTTANLPPGLQ